jgi:hypothetical protein
MLIGQSEDLRDFETNSENGSAFDNGTKKRIVMMSPEREKQIRELFESQGTDPAVVNKLIEKRRSENQQLIKHMYVKFQSDAAIHHELSGRGEIEV